MDNSMHNRDDTGGWDPAFKDIQDMNFPWRSALPLARQSRHVKGEQLKLGKDLLFLDHGRVRLAHQSPEGTEKILWYIRKGCIFGEALFFDATLDENVCICAATSCLVYAFSPASVRQISRDQPELLLNLLQSMARKVKILTSQASSLSLDSVLERLCKFLAQRLVPDSDPLTARVGITRHELASLLGVHRVSLYRVLRQQEQRGLFGPITGDTMTILRPQDFYRLAGV